MTEKKIVAITSCPVGIAHTYMAAESLEKAGKKLGIQVKVETHGSIGIENELTAEEIKEADGVIIAADTAVDKSRFGGKMMIQVGVQQGIKNPEGLIQKIQAGDAPIYQAEASDEQSDSSSKETD
ncbi:MAG: PTS fructose transporter subunit IIB, partial [Carnobacterium sp.]